MAEKPKRRKRKTKLKKTEEQLASMNLRYAQYQEKFNDEAASLEVKRKPFYRV